MKQNNTINSSLPSANEKEGSPSSNLCPSLPPYREGRGGSPKIYVAGHRGLVGSAIWNNLKARGYDNLVGRTHTELDLTDQQAVDRFFDEERPDAVVLAAAFVGGIMANSLYRADFIMQNMKMQCNVISSAYSHGVKKLLFLGSTCIYPK
ncbi:NAD-dependent epimerase/dehydratase family protein, partial [Segatella buccae]